MASRSGAANLLFDAALAYDVGSGPGTADFVYSVRVIVESGDRRSVRRRRTRLRSGKLLDLRNDFLIECQISDRSDRGARVRLLADIPAPAVIRLYEDDPERLLDARIVWRNQRDVGLCFIRRGGARRISRLQLACLRGRYYAMPV